MSFAELTEYFTLSTPNHKTRVGSLQTKNGNFHSELLR